MTEPSLLSETDRGMLVRYAAGECDDMDLSTIDRLFEQYPRERLFVAALKRELDASRSVRSSDDARASYAIVCARVARESTVKLGATGTGSHARNRQRPSIWRWGALAGAILCGGIGLIWWRSTQHAAPSHEARSYATARAERSTLRLPDGSVVTLAPESRLRYTADGEGRRALDVIGQARFEVVQDPRRAFVVRARNVEARVLGTTFDVRAYPSDAAVNVTVLTGRVAAGRVDSSRGSNAAVHRSVVLMAGMAATVGDSTRVTRDTSAATWMDGRLVFRDTPLPIVLETVGRWYGYKFRVADSSLVTRYVTTTLILDKPQESMRLLEDLLGVTMTFRDNVVTLSRTSPSGPPRLEKTPARRQSLSIQSEVGR